MARFPRLGFQSENRSQTAGPLHPHAWIGLIRVMLDYSVTTDDADEHHRGMALKFINAACAALDLARDAEVNGLATLTDRCADRIAGLSEELGL